MSTIKPTQQPPNGNPGTVPPWLQYPIVLPVVPGPGSPINGGTR